MFTDLDVFIPNLPGFGDEPSLTHEAGIPEYAKWVKDLVSQHSLKNVIILGHSFGGRIASYLASENPVWLKGLILYGAPCIYRPTVKARILKICARLARPLKFLHLNYNDEYALAQRMGLGNTYRNVVSYDQSKQLAQIHTPTTLVWGEMDTDVPLRIAHEMKTLMPKSNLIVLEKCGHNAHIDNPNLFYGTISRIISHV